VEKNINSIYYSYVPLAIPLLYSYVPLAIHSLSPNPQLPYNRLVAK